MKNVVRQSLQVAVAAIALGVTGFAAAQSAAPADAPAKHAHKHHHKGDKGGKHHHRGEGREGREGRGGDVAAGSSNAQEAAAARQADRQGQLTAASRDQYVNNALSRCSVFKMEEDKRACVERVTKGQDSGSVQGGGILREYTYTAPAK